MNPLTLEWVQKAEGDFITAQRELRARTAPNFDAACFHAQQCVEKYLKARMQEARHRFSRTHDLVKLLDEALPLEPAWESMRDDLDALSAYAAKVRYPGRNPNREAARVSVELCRSLRTTIRASLGMDGA
jgi:HEPN domain-containing protein